jgi:hypothetical protein
LVALSVSYYFLVSLPASNREKLQFEEEIAEAARLEREKKENALTQAAEERKSAFQSCEVDAETSYWNYVKLNGKEVPGKPGTYTADVLVEHSRQSRRPCRVPPSE